MVRKVERIGSLREDCAKESEMKAMMKFQSEDVALLSIRGNAQNRAPVGIQRTNTIDHEVQEPRDSASAVRMDQRSWSITRAHLTFI